MPRSFPPAPPGPPAHPGPPAPGSPQSAHETAARARLTSLHSQAAGVLAHADSLRRNIDSLRQQARDVTIRGDEKAGLKLLDVAEAQEGEVAGLMEEVGRLTAEAVQIEEYLGLDGDNYGWDDGGARESGDMERMETRSVRDGEGRVRGYDNQRPEEEPLLREGGPGEGGTKEKVPGAWQSSGH
jgi:hypothetical protein